MVLDLHAVGLKLTAGRLKHGELSPFARAAIIGAVAAGASQSAVARAFGVDRKAVQRALQAFESSDTIASKPRTGRPAVLTHREKRYILQLAKRDPRLTMKALTKTVDDRVSRSTIRRVLREHRMRKWRAQKRIPLTAEVAKARYAFACEWLPRIEELSSVRGCEDDV